jgi:hypothetical protein
VCIFLIFSYDRYQVGNLEFMNACKKLGRLNLHIKVCVAFSVEQVINLCICAFRPHTFLKDVFREYLYTDKQCVVKRSSFKSNFLSFFFKRVSNYS